MHKLLKTAAVIALTGVLGVTAFKASRVIASDAGVQTQHSSILRISAHDPLPAKRSIVIGLNKSVVIELPRNLRDIIVSSPKVLDGVVHSSRRAYLIGKKIGQANAFFMDKHGNQILTLEVNVSPDVTALNDILSRLIPGSSIVVESIGANILLTGSVSTPKDASRASTITKSFIPKDSNVLNMLSVRTKEQVMLRVKVVEMQRDIVKRLGVNWAGNTNFAEAFATNNRFAASAGQGINTSIFGVAGKGSCLIPGSRVDGASLLPAAGALTASGAGFGLSCLAHNLEVFERHGLIRTLAEPNLTAISGEAASFLAGGEFPIPVSQDGSSIGVEFKPFGVGLSFTPVVLSPKLISLRIATEVSELSTEGAITIGSLTLPALKVRRAKSTIELPSGGSMVMAGLISDKTRQNMDRLPGLGKLPVLGTLFRSRDFVKQETELVIVVTPYVVQPVAASKIARPDDGFMTASDNKANFLGDLNRVYGKSRAMPAGGYKGDYGFIVE